MSLKLFFSVFDELSPTGKRNTSDKKSPRRVLEELAYARVMFSKYAHSGSS